MRTKNAGQKPKDRRRHIRYWRLLKILAGPFLRLWFGFSPEKAQRIDAPVLVLANHTTDLDPALVALSFDEHMYFVASEHIFRWGFASRLIRYLFAPMPLIKGRSDANAAMGIVGALRDGKNICLFPEGNRSADGCTAPISPATGLLAKAGADLVTYRLEGGYFAHPRWGRGTRRGRMRGYVVGHYPAARLKTMSLAEINAAIARDLWEDAYQRQREDPVPFRSKRRAENLETALYLCPACKGVGTLTSRGDAVHCACGLSGRYTQTGMLEGEGLPFDTVKAWYDWQLTEAEERLSRHAGGTLFSDAEQSLYQISPGEKALRRARGTLCMTREALSVGARVFPLSDIANLAIVGQMTLTFSLRDGRHYEIKSDFPRSGYKYLHAFEALRRGAALEHKQRMKEG